MTEYELDDLKTQPLICSSKGLLTKRLPRYARYRTALVQLTVTLQPTQIDRVGAVLEAGASHIRINLSHYRPWSRDMIKYPQKEDYDAPWKRLVRQIRSESEARGIHTAIMLDTAGPEFRIRHGQQAQLHAGESVTLSADTYVPAICIDQKTICIEMPEEFHGFPDDSVGQIVRIKDGACEGIIEAVRGRTILLCLQQGIVLEGKNEKVNFPGVHLENIPSVGPRDYESLKFFLQISIDDEGSELVPIDYVAQSFVKSAGDVNDLSAALNTIHPKARRPLIIPKLETKESVEEPNIRAILRCRHTAAIMIARGDLANETRRSQVPRLQRCVIELCQKYWKPVLLATQIYGSMEDPFVWQNSRPEAEDLRSALDWGVDGVVLTGETAKRPDPETVIVRLLEQSAEDDLDIERRKLFDYRRNLFREEFERRYAELLDGSPAISDGFPLREQKDYSTADMAIGAVYRANHRRAEGLFPLTVNGNSVRDMVHFMPYKPIFPFTQNEVSARSEKRRKMSISRGLGHLNDGI